MNVKSRRYLCIGVASLLLSSFISGCDQGGSEQALGVVERERITLTATANELIAALPIAEGSEIKQGQILVQLNQANQQAVVAKVSAQRDEAQAALSKLLNGERPEDIEQAKANLTNAQALLTDASKQYQRLKELVSRKLASPADLDNALAQRDAAQATYNAAQQNWKKLTQGYRQEDIDVAKAKLQAASEELKLQQQKLSDLTVVATRDGILDSLPYHVGERVPTHAVVAILQANSAPYARVYVAEPYIATLEVGSEVNVHVDGLDTVLKGIVRWISVEPAFTPYSSMSEQDRSRLVYLTEIDLPDAPARLPTGIPVQVDLE